MKRDLEKIKDQIQEYFSDTSREQSETKEDLEDIVCLVEMLIESLG